MNRTVMVVAAHPDDEILGCGGTIARHARQGDQVHVLILAEGLTSRLTGRQPDAQASAVSELSRTADAANSILGVASVTTTQLPDNRMDGLDLLDIIKVVEAEISKRCPEIVYTHHSADLNVDHQLTHRAVITAARPHPGGVVKSLFFFEVVSSSDYQIPGMAPPFLANYFVDITADLEKKLAALSVYSDELRPWPHSRSLENVRYLAHVRGASVGLEAAEAFQAGRIIVS